MPLSICAPVSANWPEYELITPILMVSWALAPAGSVTAASMAAPANSERLMWSSPEFVASLVVIRMPDLPDKEKRREPLVRGAFRWASNYWRTNSGWQAAEVGERSEP